MHAGRRQFVAGPPAPRAKSAHARGLEIWYMPGRSERAGDRGEASVSALYLIDGFNFLHAVVLKGRDRARWWSPENQQAVRDWVALRPVADARACIVFDQREPRATGDGSASCDTAGELEVRHAPDADAYILACCEQLCGTREVVVVSADRSLVDRAKQRGARALSPWAFARYVGGAPA
jgi:YacP-like NYN domain-containing protein